MTELDPQTADAPSKSPTDVGMLAFALWFFTLATSPFFILIPLVVEGPLVVRLPFPIAYVAVWFLLFRFCIRELRRDRSELSAFGIKVIGAAFACIVGLLTLSIGDPDDLGCLVSLIFMTFAVPPYALMIVMLLFARRKITWRLWACSAFAIVEYIWIICRATDGFNFN